MAWLLDTHVWIWSQLEPERLGPITTALLENPESSLHVATISTLELARLQSRGEVRLQLPVHDWVNLSLHALSAASLEMTQRIAIEAYALPGAFHPDPADRILVATARQLDLILITADRRILDYPSVRTQNATQ